MLSDNKRLSLLIRKNYGGRKLSDYKSFFRGFNLKRLEYIDLENSDEIRERINNIFSAIEPEFETLENDSQKNSELITKILDGVADDDISYVFSEDVEYCGMFKGTTKSILKSCLGIAFIAYENTCFVIDSQFKFSLIISYNDIEDNYYPDKFEIKAQVVE